MSSKKGLPIPDPNCTPGAINPSYTLEVLKDPQFTTKCTRDQGTTAQDKYRAYRWYSMEHPPNNTGDKQICELDHLVPLEIGGSDTLDNIWPQCGPPGVPPDQRYFKLKDTVENYLAFEVLTGKMKLSGAQKGIAEDWTQYLDDARKWGHTQ